MFLKKAALTLTSGKKSVAASAAMIQQQSTRLLDGEGQDKSDLALPKEGEPCDAQYKCKPGRPERLLCDVGQVCKSTISVAFRQYEEQVSCSGAYGMQGGLTFDQCLDVCEQDANCVAFFFRFLSVRSGDSYCGLCAAGFKEIYDPPTTVDYRMFLKKAALTLTSGKKSVATSAAMIQQDKSDLALPKEGEPCDAQYKCKPGRPERLLCDVGQVCKSTISVAFRQYEEQVSCSGAYGMQDGLTFDDCLGVCEQDAKCVAFFFRFLSVRSEESYCGLCEAGFKEIYDPPTTVDYRMFLKKAALTLTSGKKSVAASAAMIQQ